MNIFQKIFKYVTSTPRQDPIKKEPSKCLNDVKQLDDV